MGINNVFDKLKPRALPLPVNVCLSSALFTLIFLYSLFLHSPNERIFRVLSEANAVIVIIPLVPLAIESKKMITWGKAKSTSSNVQQKVDELCQSMDIKKMVTVKLVDGWYGAKAQDEGVLLGKPLLDKLDDNSIKAVLAHELAHIKQSQISKTYLIMMAILFVAYYFYLFNVRSIPLWPNLLIFFAWCFLILVIFLRFISWPKEYEADAIAAKYVGKNTMISTLQALATLKGTDMEQDFYSHPSISKRIAKL
jgi:Zn-dependent protease with chaperone function